ncbi:MAG: AAA family ATPase, partial [Alphaproteobacteria bacterium]
MRVERLNLVRFGKFTDYELEFPSPKNEGSDVHLIYGPNEAGKSTLFAAILDLMFVIPDLSPYGFMHDYSVMRIEGGFLHKKDKIELARVKRRHADLVGIDDRPLNHDPLIGMLGGLDRAGYRAMFSLDETSLEAGGRELLQANGDFGRILFSASSGLSDLSHRLKQMDAEADAFYRRSGRQNRLRTLIETLDALKKDQETHDVNATNFDRLIETREIAKISRQEAEEEEKIAREKQAILKRRLTACSKLQDYRTAIAAVDRLRDLPEPPLDARTQLELLRDNESTLKTRHTETERRIAAQKEKLAAIEINATIVAASHQIETITDLASRYRTATQDIPKRQRSLDETVAEISARTRKLSNGKEAKPHSLFLEIEQTAKILELTRDWPVLCERVKQAQSEVTRAEATKQDCPLSDAEYARLKTILYSIRSTELLNRYQQALNEERALEIEVISAFDRLAPWEGNGEDLKSLKLPARSVLETWKNDLVSLRLRKANIQDLMDSARSRYA